MRRGACDFIQKPWENARLISIVRTQIELRGRFSRPKSWKRKIACCALKDGLN